MWLIRNGIRLTGFAALCAGGWMTLAETGPADAHEGAMGVVKQRMDAMSDMGRASKQMTEMFKGERPYDAATVARLAQAIAEDAAKLVAMFPHGSHAHPSKALPSVWEDRAGFTKSFDELRDAADRLAKMAGTASRREVMAQFFKMSRTCTACHTTYRKPD